MVERINKPEPPSPHRVERSKEAKENQQQRDKKKKGKESEAEDKPAEMSGWNKFHGQNKVVKPYRVKRAAIAKCLFKCVEMHSGTATLEAEIFWVNGSHTNSALLMLSSLDGYFKLRNFKVGDEVPDTYWARGDVIEIGIPQKTSTSGLHELDGIIYDGKGGIEKQVKNDGTFLWLGKKIGVVDRDNSKLNVSILFIYIFFLIVMTLLLIIEIKRL